MSTTSTKTRALCVATRCTSVEQFVATFHRFCGDDQTFFVATMTSRPIGLETPFSIQLADKQPVLRGMCIVLDAWATPENRYRRPGIRLGIKRLTADSQVVFDRLKAASRVPANVEATPPPGPAPLPSIASGSRPGFGRRSAATPPPLPPLLAPRATPSVPVPPPLAEPRRPLPSVAPPTASAKPVLPVVTVPPLPVVTVPPLPSTAEAKRVTPPAIDAPPVTRPTPPRLDAQPVTRPTPPRFDAQPVTRPTPPRFDAPLAAKLTPPAIDVQPVTRPTPPRLDAQQVTRPTPPRLDAQPAPVAVTRFQVALHVDTIPPPLSDVEFKPQELIPRKRPEPRIEPPPEDAPVDETQPAMIVDRRGAPVDRRGAPVDRALPVDRAVPVDLAPPVDLPPPVAPVAPTSGPGGFVAPPGGFVAPPSGSVAPTVERVAPPVAPVAPTIERDVAEPRDTLPMLAAPDVFGQAELRTPGSALVLPANPLQDLSDESIEGFIDCTIYEETENIFHPVVDGPEWADPTTESPLQTAAEPASSVPAMPFDAAPNLTVRATGDSESLTVADDPALSRTASGELGGGTVAEAVDDDVPSQPTSDAPSERPSVEITDEALAPSRTMAGELWSETVRRTPATGTPRIQPRPDTPLPRPATNVPLDLGESADPASWFDGVSLPYGASGAPAPGQATPVMDYLGPRPATPPGAFGIPPIGSTEPIGPTEPTGPNEPAMLQAVPPSAPYPMPSGALYAAPPSGPYAAPPSGAYAAPPSGPYAAPPSGAYPAPSSGPYAAPPSGPYAAPPSGPYAAPPVGPYAAPSAPYPMPPSAPYATPTSGYVTPPGTLIEHMTPPAMGEPLDPSTLSAYPISAPPYGQDEPGAHAAGPAALEGAPYPSYSAADLVMLPMPPGMRQAPPWQRWLLIGGSAFVAILIAFGLARLVRGSDRAAPAAAVPPSPARSVVAGSAAGPVRSVAAGSAASQPPAESHPAAVSAAPAAGSDEPADSAADPGGGSADAVPDDDGEAAAGSTPVVGSGPCRFTVATTPAGSIVRLDDQAMGPSPITIEGSCDKHKIDISHARYQSITRWLTLAPAQPQTLDISLPRPIHAVTVTSFPPGAELSIDGHRAGTTPTVVQMTGFATVSLTFTKPGFQAVTRKVYSKVAQDRVFVKMMK